MNFKLRSHLSAKASFFHSRSTRIPILTLSIVCMLASQLFAQDEKYQIQLKSRTFTPSTGMSAMTRAHHSSALASQPCTHSYIQFETLPGKGEREALKNRGIELLEYIGGNAYIANLCQQTSLAFAERSMNDPDSHTPIRWIGEILPTDKMTTSLQQNQMAGYAMNQDGTINLKVHLHRDVNYESAKNDINAIVKSINKDSKVFKKLTNFLKLIDYLI